MRVSALFALVLLVAPAVARADGDPASTVPAAPGRARGWIPLFGHRYSLAARVGISTSTSDAVRQEFGALGVFPSLLPYQPETQSGSRFDLDVSTRLLREADHRALVIAPTAGLRINLGGVARPVVPFVSLRTGPYVARVIRPLRRLPGEPVDAIPPTPGYRVVWGANAQAGVEIKDGLEVSARYDHVRTADADLSGPSLDVILRLF